MPRSVIRYFSAATARELEDKLDSFAQDNPTWEFVSASHVLQPGLISLVVVVKHVSNAAIAPPPNSA